jgi:integrase
MNWQASMIAYVRPRKPYTPLSIAYINKMLSYLRLFFDFCISVDALPEDKNPARKVKRVKNNREDKEMQIWTLEEFNKFNSEISDTEYKALFTFLYMSGARIGEALALKWSDYDGRGVKIHSSLSRCAKGKQAYKIVKTKTKNGKRYVALPFSLIDKIDALKSYRDLFDNRDDADFIFGGKLPLDYWRVGQIKNKYCKISGVKKIRLHDLRHSHASYLISKGCDVVSVSRRLGHGRASITLDVYAHVVSDNQDEIVKHLDII